VALSDDAFPALAKNFVLFVHITSRVPGDKHQDLMKEKGGTAFPYVAVLDAEGEVVARHRGKRTASGLREFGDKALAFVEAKKKAAAGDKRAKVQLAILRLDLDLDKHSLEDAQTYVRDLGDMTEEQEKHVEGLLTSIEVNDLSTKTRGNRAAQVEAGQKCIDMKEAGRLPTDFTAVVGFWHLVSLKALSKRDVPLYEESLGALRKACGDDPFFKDFLDGKEKALAELKEPKK
jgi:hypothetical protein